MYEDTEKRGATAPGTMVRPVTRDLSFYAESADEAEKRLRKDVASGALPAGMVYQICPCLANLELIRSVAAGLDGDFQHVFLDPAAGVYSELRRIRLPRPLITTHESVTAISQ